MYVLYNVQLHIQTTVACLKQAFLEIVNKATKLIYRCFTIKIKIGLLQNYTFGALNLLKTSFLLGIYRIPHTTGIHECVTVRKHWEREKTGNFEDKCFASVYLPHFLSLHSFSWSIYIHLYNLWVAQSTRVPTPPYGRLTVRFLCKFLLLKNRVVAGKYSTTHRYQRDSLPRFWNLF